MKALMDRHNNFSEKNDSKCIVAVQEVNSIYLYYLNLTVYGQSQIRISWKRRLFDMLYQAVTPIVTEILVRLRNLFLLGYKINT